MILLSCALIFGVIFAVIEIAWRYLSPGEPDFAAITQGTAERLFNRPPKDPPFLGDLYPRAGDTIPSSDTHQICFLIIKGGFAEGWEQTDLSFRLTLGTFIAVDGKQIETGLIWGNTGWTNYSSATFSTCSPVETLEPGIHVVQVQVRLPRDGVYDHAWAFKIE